MYILSNYSQAEPTSFINNSSSTNFAAVAAPVYSRLSIKLCLAEHFSLLTEQIVDVVAAGLDIGQAVAELILRAVVALCPAHYDGPAFDGLFAVRQLKADDIALFELHIGIDRSAAFADIAQISPARELPVAFADLEECFVDRDLGRPAVSGALSLIDGGVCITS